MKNVYIMSANRSAIGGFGGTLKGFCPVDLGTLVAKEAISRSGYDPKEIDHAVFGNVIHTEPRDMYVSRVIALQSGLRKDSAALTVNRLCGSGLQAIISAIQLLALEDASITMAGGVEVMSNGAHIVEGFRWGARMGDGKVHDMMLGALHDPFGHGHMGITAENISSRYQISRDMQDQFALTSQQRASKAIEDGVFKDQILPIEIKTRKGIDIFQIDEHLKPNTTMESLSGLRTAFKKDGVVTAGNASGINDGASALILANEEKAKKGKPLARIVSYGFGGVDPDEMGMGPVPATKMALNKAGLDVSDLDLIESNEAFAAQACAVNKQLGLDPEKVNVNGGAIALGHPVGATGAIIMTKLIYELRQRKGKYGLATMCIGGGQGIAVIIEAL
ncbi:MAG: beta-ketothiolase BktB [Alphaproteobacteria bacterium]|jgi:acetyl-CoA C-acetyltransferase|nr:beta-ketothiolase BktB [Alphaproteobacteria bacterium]|tara:strand:- start:150 stop:1322 length:1173 start_codon:yes stop_codon:yes gene_type:complete